MIFVHRFAAFFEQKKCFLFGVVSPMGCVRNGKLDGEIVINRPEFSAISFFWEEDLSAAIIP